MPKSSSKLSILKINQNRVPYTRKIVEPQIQVDMREADGSSYLFVSYQIMKGLDDTWTSNNCICYLSLSPRSNRIIQNIYLETVSLYYKIARISRILTVLF